MDKSAILAEQLNIPLSITDRTSQQKISKGIQKLNIINQVDRSSLSGPCAPQPLPPALLCAPDHHSLLLHRLPPRPGPLRPEPPAEAEGGLGGRRGPAHAAALPRTLQRLQRGWLPAPGHGRPLAEAGAHHRCLERGAQPAGDRLLGRASWQGDITCGENKRRRVPEVAATAGGGA